MTERPRGMLAFKELMEGVDFNTSMGQEHVDCVEYIFDNLSIFSSISAKWSTQIEKCAMSKQVRDEIREFQNKNLEMMSTMEELVAMETVETALPAVFPSICAYYKHTEIVFHALEAGSMSFRDAAEGVETISEELEIKSDDEVVVVALAARADQTARPRQCDKKG